MEYISYLKIFFVFFDTAWAVTCYSSVSKNQSQYRSFRFVMFLTRSQSPPDPPDAIIKC